MTTTKQPISDNRNLLQLLQENPEAIQLSKKDVVKYNAVLRDPAQVKKEGGSILYSIYEIDIANDSFKAQNINAWQQYIECSGKLSHVQKS